MEIEVKEKPIKIPKRSLEEKDFDLAIIDSCAMLLASTIIDPDNAENVLPMFNDEGGVKLRKKVFEVLDRL